MQNIRVECILPLGITQCSLPCTYKSRMSEKAKRKYDLCYLLPYCILLLINILFKLICKKGVSNITKAGNKKNEKFLSHFVRDRNQKQNKNKNIFS